MLRRTPYPCIDPPPFHAMCLVWPTMHPAQYAGVLSSIRSDGLKVEIDVWHGCIVDGRHRLRACEEAGVEPRYVVIDPNATEQEVWDELVNANLHRRQMTDHDVLMFVVGASFLPVESGRQRAKRGESQIPVLMARYGIARTTFLNARAGYKSGNPELVAALQRGDISPHAAAAQARQEKRAAKCLLPPDAQAMNDHRRMAFAAHADVEQMKAALKTLTKAATQRIRRVQAAIAHYERTGIFNVPFVSPAVIRLFDRPAQILGRWEADTTLATRHLIATTSASDLRLAREKMVASQADQLAMVDEAIAQAEAEEAPPADALPDEGAASADQLREAS